MRLKKEESEQPGQYLSSSRISISTLQLTENYQTGPRTRPPGRARPLRAPTVYPRRRARGADWPSAPFTQSQTKMPSYSFGSLMMLRSRFSRGVRFPARLLCRWLNMVPSVWCVRPSSRAAFVTLPPVSSKACAISLASNSCTAP